MSLSSRSFIPEAITEGSWPLASVTSHSAGRTWKCALTRAGPVLGRVVMCPDLSVDPGPRRSWSRATACGTTLLGSFGSSAMLTCPAGRVVCADEFGPLNPQWLRATHHRTGVVSH